jgi:hypothetical protein
VADYIKGQGRYRGINEEMIGRVQAEVDARCAALEKRAI